MNALINAILRHAPHWFLDLIEWLLARDSVMLQWIKGRAAAGIPIPPSVRPRESATVRVFFGPFNYAGQAWHWARSLESATNEVSATNLMVVAPGNLGFESDARVPTAVWAGSKRWRAQQQEAVSAYTHVLIESFTSTLGFGRRQGVVREIEWHLEQGRRVALICHGTDIRSPEAHVARNVHTPFDLSDREVQRLERRVRQNKQVMDAVDVPVFYSTPDLRHDVPHGQWLPLVIEPERWALAAEQVGREPGGQAVPVVLHAPTSKRKGTAAVEAAVESLGEAIEYRPLAGVPAQEMPAHMAQVDIVVDQLMVASYGVTACEAMAAGRVVVGNVDDEIRSLVRESAGMDLPIVQADPDTVAAVLGRLAADPEERRQAASRGPAFVRAMHTGARTHDVMGDFLAG